jgi:signal transduction histidine kinase
MFNMVSISIVLIVAFCVIYLVAYSNANKNNELRLNTVSSMFVLPNRPLSKDAQGARADGSINAGDVELSDNDHFSPNYSVSFVLFIRNNNLEYIHSYLDFDDRIYTQALSETAGQVTGQIRLVDKHWMFRMLPMRSRPNNMDIQRIVFLDISDSQAGLNVLLVTLCCVSAVVLAALFFLSMRFANRAVQPIENAYNKQKQFVADASHELRTPIAVIGANIDAIEVSGEETVASQKEWFENIQAELKRTGALIDELLYLARSDSQQKENILPIDLSLACEMACVSFEAILYENKLRFETDIAEHIIAYADFDKFKQVIYIFLDNASKYTEKGGEISLSLTAENKWAILKVVNTAVVSPSDLTKIFDRFYRPDEARSVEAGGAGLGLAIARTIIERFGGEISADSRDKKTAFTVKLKLA